MTSEHSPENKTTERSGWVGPFVARGADKASPGGPSEVAPPLHVTQSGEQEPLQPAEAVAEDAPTAEADSASFEAQALPMSEIPSDGAAQLGDVADEPQQSETESVPFAAGGGWDDEPWANTPVSEDADGDGFDSMDGDLLLDLPSVALPLEGIDRSGGQAPLDGPADSLEERDAPDWQQWLRDNQETGGHHFPPLEDDLGAADSDQADAAEPMADMGGDLTGLEHYDWNQFADEDGEQLIPEVAPAEGLEAVDEKPDEPIAAADGLIQDTDYGWLDLGGDEESTQPVDAADDTELPELASRAPASAESSSSSTKVDAEVEQVAARLERIARSLRENGLTGPLADRDPLGALIAGYLLGSTARDDRE